MKNDGYQMFETASGLCYDVSYDSDTGDDVIELDGIDSSTIYLTKSDLVTMLGLLE